MNTSKFTSTERGTLTTLQAVYTDLQNGKYPGKGYATFSKHYKGDNYFWKALHELNIIDFNKPQWIAAHPPSMSIVKRASDKSRAINPLYKNKVKAPVKIVAKLDPRPIKAIQKKMAETKRALEPKRESKEIVLLWGLFKYKKS